MTSISSLPQAAISTSSPSIAAASAAAKATRAADGDYKTKGVGHEVKDADGDYKATNTPASTTASSTLAAVTSMKLGG